jgi:hypothetical protein
MSSTRALSVAVSVGFLLVVSSAFPPPVRAAWVNSAGTQFQVGGQLTQIIPTAAGTSFVDPSCGSQGGTSLALVQGLKLAGVDPILYPAALVVSCLDSNPAIQARLNFINPADGKVIKQLSTTAVPTNGWAHFVHRQDKGDLLACGNNGALYSIDFSQTTTTLDGTATLLASPPEVTTCKGLTWDAEADVIYVGISVTVGETTTNRVVRFNDGATTPLGTFTAPCATNGLAVSGGVLLVSCQGALTVHRLDKNTGVSLGVHGTLTATGLANLGESDPGLGDFACDPVTFHKDETGRDLFTDALWSRRGANGNGVVALEFPAFTCGLPSSSVVLQGLVPYSPLAAGLSVPGLSGPGQLPLAACFDATGNVKDLDGDGLPDCWETNLGGSGPGTDGGIDFDGDGSRDLQLCAQVNTNGDGVTLTRECASPSHKDLFAEIDYMQDHKPDPQALSQTQSVATVGVKSVREAFAAAPVANPDTTIGIRIHFQVDEQVIFTPLSGPPTSHVNQVAFTPCTGPAINAIDPAQAVDFDTIKAANFGTATERVNLQALNAKRLAFRYVVFAHQLVGNPGGGSNGSGCAEIGGDDAVVTLGSFALTTVNNVSHRRGTTDQQAGTFMHEFGHLLGFGHGGLDNINCKPNYRSVMSYARQFAGSPIPNRRLDYSRAADPVLTDINKTGLLNETAQLNEGAALGTDPSRGPIPPFFPLADTIVYGPNAWSVVSATAPSINWDRSKSTTPQPSVTANINAGATAGCDGTGTQLEGQDDWSNVLYRSSAAINFAGGREVPLEMTSDNEKEFFLNKDTDNGVGNGVGDGKDCGGTIPDPPDGTTSFSCTHRIDIKPAFPLPKIIDQTGNVMIVIFSEKTGTQEWNAPAQVKTDASLKFMVESFEVSVKVNNKGGGTCSVSDVADPDTGQKDGIKDLKCQFEFPPDGPPAGTHFGIVSGFFFDPLTGDNRAFSARQEVTIVR